MAARTSVTTTCGQSISSLRSTTSAQQPFATACGAKSCASTLPPRMQKNRPASHFARESAVNVPITVCALPVISTSSGMPSVNCSRFIIIPPMLWLCFAPYGAIVPHGTSNVTSTRVPAGAYVPPAGLCLAARPSPCAFISNPFLLNVCAHSRMPIPITSGTQA